MNTTEKDARRLRGGAMITTPKDARAISRSTRAALIDLERDIMEADGLISPDQEAEQDRLASLDSTASGAMVVEFEIFRIKRLKVLIDQGKRLLSQMQDRADSYRAKMTSTMARADVKRIEDPDGLFAARWNAGRGKTDLAPGCTIEDVDPTYVKTKVVLEIDRDLARAAFEAGIQVAGLVYVKEPFVTITVNKDRVAELELRGALAELEEGR